MKNRFLPAVQWIRTYKFTILTVISCLFFIKAYESHIVNIFDNHILPYIQIEYNTLTNVLFFVIVIYFIYKLIMCSINKYIVEDKYIIYSAFFISIYTYYRYTYCEKYFIIPWDNYGYADCLVILLALFIVISIINSIYLSIKQSKSRKRTWTIKAENPIKELEEDLLEYKNEARLFVEHTLKKIDPKESYSIGILSEWGIGKTSYMHLIKSYLKDESKHFITIGFNPRLSKTVELIQKDFFDILRQKLSPYCFFFSPLVNRYMQSINVLDNSIINSITNILSFSSNKHYRKKIAKALSSIEKQIVIFIDDLDRLNKEEIIEVFKLIYENASFPNIIFITAYDKKYICNLLSDLSNTQNTPYSDKFFDKEVNVPIRTYGDYYKILIDQLKEKYPIEDKTGIVIVDGKQRTEHIYYSSLYNFPIKYFLHTPRDIKRFLTLFEEVYDKVRDEANFVDLFLLTLLRYKFNKVYQMIYDKEIIELKSNTGYTLKASEIIKTYEFSDEVIKILEHLFPINDSINKTFNFTTYRSIDQLKYFNVYFRNIEPQYLSLEELNNILQKDNNGLILQLDEWLESGNIGDFIEFVEKKSFLDFEDWKYFKKYILSVFYTYAFTQNNILFHISVLLLNIKEQYLKHYNIEKESFKEYIKSIITDCNLGHKYASLLRNIALDKLGDEFIFSKSELNDITITNLKSYTELHSDSMSQTNMDLLYACIDSVSGESRKVQLNPNACQIVKEQIIKHPKGYFENFIHLGGWSSSPDFNSIACEPFWNQIFGGTRENAEKELLALIDNIPNKLLVSNFWELYKANNYEPISFEGDGNVQEKIDNNLVQEKDSLNKLFNIDNELIKLKKEFVVERKSKSYLINEIGRLKDELHNIKLYIKKTGQINNDVQDFLLKLTQDVELNETTFVNYVINSGLCQEIEDAISKNINNNGCFHGTLLDRTLDNLLGLNINSINRLEAVLIEYKEKLIDFVYKWYEDKPYEIRSSLVKGTSVIQLGLYLLNEMPQNTIDSKFWQLNDIYQFYEGEADLEKIKNIYNKIQ